MIEFKRVRESDLEIIMNWRSSRKISKYLITEVSKDNALPDRDSKIEISPIPVVIKNNVIQNYPNNSEEIYF